MTNAGLVYYSIGRAVGVPQLMNSMVDQSEDEFAVAGFMALSQSATAAN
jgi:hypothetical protein